MERYSPASKRNNVQLIDTHCHIHELAQKLTPVHDKWFSDGVKRTPEQVIASAHEAGVEQMLCVGTTLEDSLLAVEFAGQHASVSAVIGIHPHDAKSHNSTEVKQAFATLLEDSPLGPGGVVGVGECGLDFFYNNSSRDDQIAVLRFQIELAQKYDLPLNFHVREAFDDFWPIFDELHAQKPLRGVLHSFTDSLENMQVAIERGLYIGVNGIATFAKSEDQRTMYCAIPAGKLVIETDAPFLTPVPFRGNICEPKHVAQTHAFLAELRRQQPEELARITSENARTLFGLE